MVNADTTRADVKAAIDGKTLPTAPLPTEVYNWPLDLGAGRLDESTNGDHVYTYVSQACQMNFDVRDFGILNNPSMTTSDSKWKETSNAGPDEISNKLHAFSLHMIAALNYQAVARSHVAAWACAYGIGCGILPATASRYVREYVFHKGFPIKADIDAVIAFVKLWREPVIVVSMNVLAAFGLFHLSKDHTF